MSDSEKEMPSPGKEITAEESDKQDVKDTDNTEKASPKKDSPKKSPKKTPKKHKEESEDESEDEEEPKLGLLERPVVLESGKRERKKVERLSNEISSDTPKEKKLEIPEGKGDKLGDCARIEHVLIKTKADELKLLHRVLYGRIAPNSEVKKNIRKFCGFDFEKDSAEYAKKVTTINKLFLAPLKFLCNVLDVEKKGTKEDIVNRMMDFLINPKDSGKPLPKSKRSKSKDKTKRKRKTKQANSEKKEKKSKSPKKEVKSDENVSVSDSGSEVSDISDSEDEGSASDIEEPKAKKAKIESSKKENSPKKKPEPKKKAEVKKKEIKPKKEKKSLPPKKRKVAEDTDSDSDDEPLIAKKKSPPTNDQIKDVIKKFLDGANLEEVTMKTVLKQVYAEFPDFDLTERKDFIKSTVKQIIT